MVISKENYNKQISEFISNGHNKIIEEDLRVE